MSDDPVLAEMLAALERSPEVTALRVRVIELLAERGRYADALGHCGVALGQSPGDTRVVELLQQCTAALAGQAAPSGGATASADTRGGQPFGVAGASGRVAGGPDGTVAPGAEVGDTPSGAVQPNAEGGEPFEKTDGTLSASGANQSARESDSTAREHGYDWEAAEDQVADIVAPAFIERSDTEEARQFVRSRVTMADVGGMDQVKRQLDLALFGPLRNPELAKAFNTSARGGMLLYGPPGCGKTFIASAVAGELGANFYPIEIADILNIYIGASERNLHGVFEVARRNAPCVLFLDEVDALGHKRSQMSGSAAMRTVVNQLLNEMDSVAYDNEGVYILGATNHPWDVDVALRRPGRFDRMILVALPDPAARASILRYHLRERPVAGIDIGAMVDRTEGFSGADLAHICTMATQLAMAESLRTGAVRPIGMPDLEAALGQIRPSAGAWFESARNVVEFANGDGSYDDLALYLKQMKMR